MLYQYTAMLHTSTSIGYWYSTGQYYWILDALLGIVLTLQVRYGTDYREHTRDWLQWHGT